MSLTIMYLICFGFGVLIAKSEIDEDRFSATVSIITGLLFCVYVGLYG